MIPQAAGIPIKDSRRQEKLVRVLATIQLLLDGSATSRPELNHRICSAVGKHRSDKTTLRDLQFIKTAFKNRFRGNEQPRFQAKLVRTLRIIDMLAEHTRPASVAHITQRLNAHAGTQWNLRTVRRDMYALKALGLVSESSGFTLDRERSNRLLTVAKLTMNESE